MLLITKKLIKIFKMIGSQDKTEDLIVISKYYNPIGYQKWYAVEYNEQKKIFYGYITIFGELSGEWGYFSLKELKSVKLPFGLKIERDIYFQPTYFSELNLKKDVN